MKAIATLTLTLSLALQFFTVVQGNAASCPTDFDYVHQIPWNSSYCQPKWGDDAGQCCETLLILINIGVAQHLKDSSIFFFRDIGLAQHLKDSSIFMFPDYASATACIAEFQKQLSSMATVARPPSFIIDCLNHTSTGYVSNRTLCDGIQTKQDWFNLLGTTAIDSSCKGDLSDVANCNLCLQDADQVVSILVGMNRNVSQASALLCVAFTYLYAAAVNEFGPKSPKTASCVWADCRRFVGMGKW